MPPPLVLLILGTGEFVDKLSPSIVGTIYGILSGLGVSFLVIRSKVLEIENAGYIKASRIIGGSKFYIATRHVQPISCLQLLLYSPWLFSSEFVELLMGLHSGPRF